MLIWFDSVTAKEPLLFDAIGKALEEKDHEVIFTCRKYDYVDSLFSLLKREVTVIGKHGGGTLFGKLMAGAQRIEKLGRYINSLKTKPNYHICFGCPESTRVAFGLGIPVININDSPHAEAVGKLTIPLSKYLVYSKSIEKSKWFKLGALEKQLYPYDGIDEVAWLKNFKPNKSVLNQLKLTGKRFIIARPEESSAAYMLQDNIQNSTRLDEIFNKIFTEYSGLVVVFPRYESQKRLLEKEFGDKIIIPPKAVDTLSLSYYADLCITGGATMAREAAALGTPAISYYPRELDVLTYIANTGIPLYNEYKIEDAIKRALSLLRKTDKREILRKKTKKILTSLESPVDAILQILS